MLLIQAKLTNRTIPIIFVEPDGNEKEVQAELGKNLLQVAHENNIELEGLYPKKHSFFKTSLKYRVSLVC